MFYYVGDARNDPGARQDALGGRAQRRIFQKFNHAELAAETLPMALRNDPDKDAFATGGLENIIDRPSMFTLRHRPRFVAGHFKLNHVLSNQKKAVFKQADADIRALRSGPLLVERGKNRDRTEHAAHDVIGG